MQSRRLTVPEDQHPAAFDGMAELWFDDVDALLQARESLEWKASNAGEANFIDHTRVAYFASEEHVVL